VVGPVVVGRSVGLGWVIRLDGGGWLGGWLAADSARPWAEWRHASIFATPRGGGLL